MAPGSIADPPTAATRGTAVSTRRPPRRRRRGLSLAAGLVALTAAATPSVAGAPTHLATLGVWLDADPAWGLVPAGESYRLSVGGVALTVVQADFTNDRLPLGRRCSDLADVWQRSPPRAADPVPAPAPGWAIRVGYGPHALVDGATTRLCVDRSGIALMVRLATNQLDDAGAQQVAAAIARATAASPSGHLVFPTLAIEVPAAAWPSTVVAQEVNALGETLIGAAVVRWDAWLGLVPDQPVRFRTDTRPCSRQLLDAASRPLRPDAAADAPAPVVEVAGGIAQGYEPYLVDAGSFGSMLCAPLATGALLAHVSAGGQTDAQHERLIDALELVAARAAARVAAAPAVVPTIATPTTPAIAPPVDAPAPRPPRRHRRRWWAHPTAHLEVGMFESTIAGRDFTYGLGAAARWEHAVKTLRLGLRGELIPLGGPLTWTAEARAGLRLPLPIDVSLTAGLGADAVGTDAEDLPAAPYALVGGEVRLGWFRFEYTHVSRAGADDEVDTERRQLYFLRIPAGRRSVELGGGWISYRLGEFQHARGIRIAMGVTL